MGVSVSTRHAVPSDYRPSGSEFMTSKKTGLRIFTHEWIADDPRACVFLCHGFGEHCRRYDHVAAKFNESGISVYSMDHHGHGRSEGLRTYVENFSDYIDDVFQRLEDVIRKTEGKPLFLMGHSMGGAISTYSLIRNQGLFRGCVLSAPLIMNPPDIAKPYLLFLADKLSTVIPKVPITPLDARLTSRDPDSVQRYINDPLNYHGNIRVRFGSEVAKTLEMFQAEIPKITIPFIVFQGTADKMVDPRGAQFLYDHASSTDKTIRTLEGLYHEILNEPEKERIMEEMVEWIQRHI